MNWKSSSNGCIDASTWANSTRAELHRKKDTGPLEREEEQLLRRCDEYINSIIRCDQSTYTLTVLGVEGFLPGYGVYEGGITASAQRGFARRPGPRAFDLNRSNVVALREFVPGNRLYANRGTFYVARYHLGAEETARIRTLRVNVEKGCVTEQAGDASYGQSGGAAIDALPLTDLDLAQESRITEDENLRFSMPVCVLGRLRKRNRGGKAFKIGDMEVSHVRGQGIELVNLGEAGRVKQGELGHWICSVCGASKTPYAVPAEIAQFMKIHKERCGRDVANLALTVQADVDLLQFHAVQNESDGINIGEALRTAAARLLDMGPDDLQLLIVEKPDDKHDLLIYDPMPGGSGLLEQMLVRWQELIATAKNLLAGCVQECETACYACLKTFRNQFYHPMLNRHDGLELMDKLNFLPEGYRDIVPVFEEEKPGDGTPSNPPEAVLVNLLKEHHFPEGQCRKRIITSLGIATTPDWLHEPTKVAVYLDGMSRGLHGDPNIAKKDHIIRAGHRTRRLQGHRGSVPRPERPPGGAAAFAEHRPGDGAGRFDKRLDHNACAVLAIVERSVFTLRTNCNTMSAKTPSFDASASALGYLYQCRYALLIALQALQHDDDLSLQISIEKLDDVAFFRVDESAIDATELIQFKHHVNKAGGLSDKSPDIWKTLRIWSELILTKKVALDHAVFLMVTTSSSTKAHAVHLLLTTETCVILKRLCGCWRKRARTPKRKTFAKRFRLSCVFQLRSGKRCLSEFTYWHNRRTFLLFAKD